MLSDGGSRVHRSLRTNLQPPADPSLTGGGSEGGGESGLACMVSPSIFFDELRDGASCDRNWHSTFASGQLSRPRFPKGSAPALLGLQDHVYDKCSSLVSRNDSGASPAAWHAQGNEDTMILRCEEV
eukprot:4981556-Prymnesium_polylepis.1